MQAFQQPLLEACGRSHSLEEVHAALAAVRGAGPPSWSLDLISGLPGLTRQLWQDSLLAAIAARPPHISVYDLQVGSDSEARPERPVLSLTVPVICLGRAWSTSDFRLLG